MVAGDAVNTAARVQSAATAGKVLVDTTTRRLAGLAIEFDLHGEVELKGKAEPETLWQAREIVSGIGGAQRTDGLEAPFVGRAVELGLLKDVLHATGAQRRPRLVLVSGPAGVGKTGWAGSWRSTSTGWPRTSTGTAGGARRSARTRRSGR